VGSSKWPTFILHSFICWFIHSIFIQCLLSTSRNLVEILSVFAIREDLHLHLLFYTIGFISDSTISIPQGYTSPKKPCMSLAQVSLHLTAHPHGHHKDHKHLCAVPDCPHGNQRCLHMLTRTLCVCGVSYPTGLKRNFLI
jgi:hypothetical protein